MSSLLSTLSTISCSGICFFSGGGSKNVAQITNTTDDSTIASKTFLPSTYFFPFFKLGAGSKPSFPPKNFIG